MREIRFRGKRVDNGEWVYGGLTKSYGTPFIGENGDFLEVIPNTVGQYTGLKDKNGKEIYEGDIVEAARTDWQGKEYNKRSFEIKYIELENCGCCTTDSGIGFDFQLERPNEVKVIGTIYDTKEEKE